MNTWFNFLSEDCAILNFITLNIITITERLLWKSFYEKSPKQIPTKAIFFNDISPFSKTAINHALATCLKSKNFKIAAKIFILAQISGGLILCKILNNILSFIFFSADYIDTITIFCRAYSMAEIS